MTQIIKPIRIFCVNLCLVFTVAAQAPEILKIDPPSWWTRSSLNPVRVMIRGRNLHGARVQIPGLRVGAPKINERGTYIGRTCHWRDCRPGVRQSCDALHCGRRPYLHDDLDAIRLNSSLVVSPPVTLWPHVERRGQLPPDVEEIVAAFEHAV